MMTCAGCGEENPARARFCLGCGTPLHAPAGQGKARKTVTVVFCDVVGSTDLGARLDPEPLGRVMARWFDRARQVFERHEGTVAKFIGDAVMAVFGVPSVREDDAVRAVRAAGELGPALDDLNAELARDWGVTIQVRTGINTGEVIVGDPALGDALVLGDAVNVAARLEQAAAPGEVLLGQPTWRLVRDAVQASPVAPLSVKGKGEPVSAWRLIEVLAGAPGHARRLDAPMVGRAYQLRLLSDMFVAAADDRACWLLTVLGAAGVGKSRLVAEFLATVGEQATVLQARCLSYGEGITYWPVAELLRQAAGLVEADPPEVARAKLEGMLAGEEHAALLAERLAGLLGLAEPTHSPEEFPWAVRRLFEALARERPLVVVLDDLHWAEPTLLDLVEHIADWSHDAPLLLCCLARPELLDARPSWGGGKRNAASIFLEPLDPTESERLVDHLLGQSALSETARLRIVDTAEGNPLFVEELLGMLIDEGLLTRADGHWAPTTDLAAVPVPTSIAALLAARLDQLDGEERMVVERASVVGQVFYPDAVAALAPDVDRSAIDRCLTRLVRKDLIRPGRSDLAGQDAFSFRHLLIRDAAYQAMPKAVRAELHERLAGWLERVAAERLGEYQELLAYHLEQAYGYRAELGPVDTHGHAIARMAAERLAEAGRRALALGDMPAAAKLLGRAAALPVDTRGRPELLVDLGRALLETGALEQGEATLTEAAAAVEARGDPLRAWRITLECSWLRALHGRERRTTEEIRQQAEQAIVALTEVGDDAGLARAWLLLSEVHNVWGAMAAMAQAAEHAVDHAQRAGDLPQADLGLWRLGIAMALGPMPVDEGIQRGQQLLDHARGRRRIEAEMLRTLARMEARRGRFDQARALLTEGRAIVEDLGLMLNMASFAWVSGEIEALADQAVAAERELRLADDLFSQLGDNDYRATIGPYLAEMLRLQGRDQEARRLTDQSEAMARPDDIVAQLRWRKTRARLLADQGASEQAERLAREAVVLAERTDFPEEHADALMSLVEVLRRAGHADEAVPVTRQALALYEGKGNTIMARRTRQALDALTGGRS